MDSYCRFCNERRVLPVPVGSRSGESFRSTLDAEQPPVVESSVGPCNGGGVQVLDKGGLDSVCFG